MSRLVHIGGIAACAALFTVLAARPAHAQGAVNPLANCDPDRSRAVFRVDGKDFIAGDVVLICDDTTVYADEIRWDDKTMIATGATGRLLVIQDGLRVNASRVEMDRQTRLGTFYDVYGTARLTDQPITGSPFGALEADVMFSAEKIERIGPHAYRMTNGWFTTCVQPEPRWEMRGSSGTIILDDRVSMRNVLFRVKGVPVLYFPYLYYPLRKDDRKTGFLIPTYSMSEVRGHGFSAAFFWAINRSQDATFYYDAFTRAGQGGGLEYRYVAGPGAQGQLKITGFDEREQLALDGAILRPARRTYDVTGGINQALGSRFRLIGNVTYFSDVVTRQLYQQNTYDFSNNRRALDLSIAGTLPVGESANRLRIEAVARQEDRFSGFTSAQRFSRLPQFSATLADKEVVRDSRVYFGGFADFARLETREDLTDPTRDRAYTRLDGRASLRAALSRLDWLSVTTAAGWRLTRWFDSLDPETGLPVASPITRSLFDVRLDVAGPVLQRIVQTPDNGYAVRFRHRIEPRVTFAWRSPFDAASRILPIDPYVDRVATGTTSIDYALINTVQARARTAGGGSVVRDVFSVGVGQTYYSDATAGADDPGYLTRTEGNFRPIWLTATASPTDLFHGRFQMYIHPYTLGIQSYSATSFLRLKDDRFRIEGGWSKRNFLPGVPGHDNPAAASHFLNSTVALRGWNGRAGGTYGMNWDITNHALVQQRFLVHYNAQCCGFAFDYQIRSLGHLGGGTPSVDRRWNVSVTLAGIGSFSNPFGAFRQ